MGFLNEIVQRPRNEMPYLLLVVGHPARDCTVPDVARLPLEAVTAYL